jgi:predicted O-linked N-acetylglucosamine transferase (SPINDLY family)
VLWLLSDNPAVVGNLRREAARRGISEDRLVFAPRLKQTRHLARFSAADLFLDTAPYGAHTTASDALWTGVPVLTRTGQSFASRVASGLLHAAGLPELITESQHDYEALAIKIATTPDLCVDLKIRLLRSRDTCALFDTPRFRDHLESAYMTMWQRWQRGESPASFAV